MPDSFSTPEPDKSERSGPCAGVDILVLNSECGGLISMLARGKLDNAKRLVRNSRHIRWLADQIIALES